MITVRTTVHTTKFDTSVSTSIWKITKIWKNIFLIKFINFPNYFTTLLSCVIPCPPVSCFSCFLKICLMFSLLLISYQICWLGIALNYTKTTFNDTLNCPNLMYTDINQHFNAHKGMCTQKSFHNYTNYRLHF